MSRIRLLIVDDSKLVQDMLATLLSSDDEIEIVDLATNGQEAIEKVKALKPDFMTIDISMPVMDGIEAIENIMAKNALPILVISDIQDAKTAYIALSKGALDVYPKSEIQPGKAPELIKKIKLLAKVKVIRHIKSSPKTAETVSLEKPKINAHDFTHVVAIACSTGGPKALSVIFPQLPKTFPYPIVVAQHIENGFVHGLAMWLNNVSSLPVKMGVEGEKISAGTIYISSSDKHMEIDSNARVRYYERQPKDIHHPSCNRLLSSVASVFKENAIGVILTGMSNDGVLGIKDIKENGGSTIAQDEESSSIFGMPREAINSGCIDKVLPLDKISQHLQQLVKHDDWTLK